MHTRDYIVLVGYFAVMILIGVISSFKIKKQEDYFMGGRSFGKLMQTFAAFGAGTGSNEPVQVGGTVWGSGLSGIWSVLLWLFVTPFYWITGVWYRRMRHITLGDWFVERYQSQAMGVGYTIFALVFYMFYLSTMFSAISKVAVPLIGPEALEALNIAPENLKFYLVPAIALIVVFYGILGGIAAAYWTDLIQGLCIIALSVVLIPQGLHLLAVANGAGPDPTMMQGFEALHERLPDSYFAIVGGPQSSQFPLHYIFSLTALAILGIVVQPHFIATGGGTAKTENAARVGLVTGNFLKRLCTIGWAITSLIVLALLASNLEIAGDPEMAWGIATREILGPMNLGLVGLMLACLMAALMSSADTYMLVASALVVRNCYAPYVDSKASERTYINIGRVSGLIMVIGAVFVAVTVDNVFGQFKMAIELP
ncbi:MAG: sodium:solute symporter family protein, partial [Pirellulales bacterium]